MQKRERILAIILGVLLLGMALWLSYSKVSEAFRRREAALEILGGKLQAGQKRQAQAAAEQQKLDAWREQSLPGDLLAARTEYQNWLHSVATHPDVALDDILVDSTRAFSRSGAYHELSFSLRGNGTLDQLTAFLYHFYRARHLHKITRLTATPIADSRQLKLFFTVKALSLPHVARQDTLAEGVSERLAKDDLEAYRSSIVDRNLFDYNESPELSELRDRDAPKTRELRVSLRARDPDRDALSYRLLEGPPGASVSSSGTFSWTPSEAEEVGKEYAVRVEVSDDGIPVRSVAGGFNVRVTPEPPQPPPPRPIFDPAAHAVVIFIYSIDGTPGAWIDFRTLERGLLEVSADAEKTYEKGGFEFQVLSIDPDEEVIEIKTKDGTRRVRLGDSLVPNEGV